MIQLPNVTLLCLATRDHEQAANALIYSMRGIEFGAVKLVSDHRPHNLPENILWEHVHRMSTIDDWNHKVFYNLWKYFDTEYVLFVHPDGFVVNPQSWKPEFLHYDYIGSPWSIACCHAIRGSRVDTHEINRVGNSVGIRSRKLCKVPSEIGIPWMRFNGDYNEDTQITNHWRQLFVEQGCTFAPFELAIQFGREEHLPEHEGVESFLFHKWLGPNHTYPRF